jgi:hypothetical protein
MMGLAELQLLTPLPNQDALASFISRTVKDLKDPKDQKAVSDALRGLPYRDFVIQFGSPSVKFQPLIGRKSRPEAWVWESPSGDLYATFHEGVAVDASVNRTGYIRKWLEDQASGE